MIRRKTKTTTIDDFIQRDDFWFDALNEQPDRELILTDNEGKPKLVVMSESHYSNTYEDFLPDEKTCTYEDFCGKK